MNQPTAAGLHAPSNDEIKAATGRLIELSIKWSSDKYYNHSYIEHTYGRLFAGRKVQRVCELGIGYASLMAPFLPEGVPYCHGSSLRMWSEYWPEAQVFGCDIRDDVLFTEGNIKTTTCDQSSPSDLVRMVNWFGGDWDVVIDDGSHMYQHQINTAHILLPYVAAGGVYIIEDTYPDKGAELASMFGGQLITGSKRPDDCLVVIQR